MIKYISFWCLVSVASVINCAEELQALFDIKRSNRISEMSETQQSEWGLLQAIKTAREKASYADRSKIDEISSALKIAWWKTLPRKEQEAYAKVLEATNYHDQMIRFSQIRSSIYGAINQIKLDAVGKACWQADNQTELDLNELEIAAIDDLKKREIEYDEWSKSNLKNKLSNKIAAQIMTSGLKLDVQKKESIWVLAHVRSK